MNYFLTISEAAEDDIREAFLWYEEQLPRLGVRFEEHISSAMLTILENPLKFQVRYSGVRICFLKKFPYGIHFVINEFEILVVSVFHTSRSPKRWNRREG
jgi:plasmid stabilization system protein ParE